MIWEAAGGYEWTCIYRWPIACISTTLKHGNRLQTNDNDMVQVVTCTRQTFPAQGIGRTAQRHVQGGYGRPLSHLRKHIFTTRSQETPAWLSHFTTPYHSQYPSLHLLSALSVNEPFPQSFLLSPLTTITLTSPSTCRFIPPPTFSR